MADDAVPVDQEAHARVATIRAVEPPRAQGLPVGVDGDGELEPKELRVAFDVVDAERGCQGSARVPISGSASARAAGAANSSVESTSQVAARGSIPDLYHRKTAAAARACARGGSASDIGDMATPTCLAEC